VNDHPVLAVTLKLDLRWLDWFVASRTGRAGTGTAPQHRARFRRERTVVELPENERSTFCGVHTPHYADALLSSMHPAQLSKAYPPGILFSSETVTRAEASAAKRRRTLFASAYGMNNRTVR
jgi:hypothetical protein